MTFNILSTVFFEKDLKSLAKKYPSIKKDVASLVRQLEVNPKSGMPIGNNCYKIRMAISSKGKGKSGGARVITHLYINHEVIYLLCIYDKSEAENISNKIIEYRLRSLH